MNNTWLVYDGRPYARTRRPHLFGTALDEGDTP